MKRYKEGGNIPKTQYKKFVPNAVDNTSVQKPLAPNQRFIPAYNETVIRQADPYFSPGLRDQYKKEYEWNQTKQNVIKPIVQGVDIATDLMQLGNFIPHPIGQTIGKIGNIAGMGVDAFQVGMNLQEGDYRNAAINAGSMIVPMALESKSFRRNSKYLTPGQPLYSFSPQATGSAKRVQYLEPFNETKHMQTGNLAANRALLGTLGLETEIDTKQNGGIFNQYKNGGQMKKTTTKQNNLMQFGVDYQFPGNIAYYQPTFQQGGHASASGHPNMFWNGDRWVSSAGDSGTYSGGTYFQNGGIHIKKSHEGRFTEYKQRTGKTTEEALHSPDPHVRQMANFARNAAKWHHEYGGSANPFHPLARYMAYGGQEDPGAENEMERPEDQTPNPQPADPFSLDPGANPPTDPTGVVPPVTATDVTGNRGDTQGEDVFGNGQQQTVQPKQRKNPYQKWANAGQAAVAGLGYLSYERGLKNAGAYQRGLGMSSNIPAVNQPGGHGDYTQYGDFRPDQRVPTQPGMFYPGNSTGSQQGANSINTNHYNPRMAPGGFRVGGAVGIGSTGSISDIDTPQLWANGGHYQGQELDVDDATIERLKRMGYKFDIL